MFLYRQNTDFAADFKKLKVMAMAESVLMYVLFFVGLVLIIKGGDWFVDSSGSIAGALGVPKFIIGATIVSVATTLPEMIVSVRATAAGNVDMAAGNAIGSVTANTAMIMGFLILVTPYAVKRRDFAPKAAMMVSAAVILILGCLASDIKPMVFEGNEGRYYTLSPVAVILLLALCAAFLAENYISMKKSRDYVESDPNGIGLIASSSGESEKNGIGTKQIVKQGILFVLGALGIILGADLLVKYGTMIAKSLDIPQRVISVVAIAIGTSLPELVTAVTAIRKKQASLSVGNIVGANIIDLTLILPICSFVSIGKGTGPLAVSVSSVAVDMAFCLAAIAVLIIPTVIKKRFSRWQGLIALAGYVFYVIAVIF